MNPRGFMEDLKTLLPYDQQIMGYVENFGPEFYHRWYYHWDVWRHVSFMGVYCAKNVSDLWNYQEIIWDLKPGLIVELGTYAGGSALYFAWLMRFLWQGIYRSVPYVLTIDCDRSHVDARVLIHPEIKVFDGDSASEETAREIRGHIQYCGPLHRPSFFILDSDHSKDHVLAELEMLRNVTRPGDYVVVEDSNINGHPVLPDFGPGPWEAIGEYEARHPGDYRHDTEREVKFGFTFAPRGYLIRI